MTLDLGALALDPGTRTILVCGSGGVGKTTTAAALAVHAAQHGRRVVVMTIDPARRLAQSLGLTALDSEPRRVHGIGDDGGSLDAMMLDMKRTFDEVIEAHATPEQAAQVLANPFYQQVSGSFAGTQEYMAMEALGRLRRRSDADGTWDLVVVDTPPSRNALDFLDAPQRLGRLVDGPFLRLLTAPAARGGRLAARATAAVTGAMTRLLGNRLLADAATFATLMEDVFGGFRERAAQTYAELSAPGTRFLVVTTPEPDAVREADFFVDRLTRDAMPLAGIVVNKTMPPVTGSPGASGLTAAAVSGDREEDLAGRAAAVLLRLGAARASVAEEHAQVVRGVMSRHPGVPVAVVPAEATDVHDAALLIGLVEHAR